MFASWCHLFASIIIFKSVRKISLYKMRLMRWTQYWVHRTTRECLSFTIILLFLERMDENRGRTRACLSSRMPTTANYYCYLLLLFLLLWQSNLEFSWHRKFSHNFWLHIENKTQHDTLFIQQHWIICMFMANEYAIQN